MSENEKHGAESGNVETVAIPPDAGEEPTIPDVSGDLTATMMLDTPTEPALTQALSEEDEPPTPTKVMSAEGASEEYRRIGTGVPGADAGTNASQISPAMAAAWHGSAPKKPHRALLGGWLLPLVVLVGVIVLLLWQHVGGRLSVSGVGASARTSLIGCDSTETVTATLHTNGKPGTIEYRWVRSDGTVSDELQQRVGAGTTQLDVVLRWAFTGHGSMHALATIDVQSPGSASAVATFDYSCP